ncbi:MAG TPA: hypothetical protein VM285_13405 [Polyangia bacterium]|nr:hypothetical protein [Polyangia bacterium]
MSQTAFDASGFVRFDLASGRIRSAANETLALVPWRLLDLLAPGGQLVAVARDWGRIHGERLAAAARDSQEPAPIEALADALGGVLAVAGLGRVTVETRGDALLFRAVSPGGSLEYGSAPTRDLLVGFVAGFLTAIDPAGFDVLPLPGTAGEQLLWAGSPPAVARVRAWMDEGEEPMQAMDRLSRGGDR